jgi:hypothetical protein
MRGEERADLCYCVDLFLDEAGLSDTLKLTVLWVIVKPSVHSV